MDSSERNIKSLEGYRQYLLSESSGKVGTNFVVSIYKVQTGTLLSADPSVMERDMPRAQKSHS